MLDIRFIRENHELLYAGKYNLHAESDSHIYRSMLTIDLN